METITRNLEDLLAFHAVATEGSFTRAAQSLNTSKAMLSKQVKRLETYVRSQLFHRTTRTVSLTEEGTALLSYSRKILELSDEAGRRLRDMTQGSTGVIRISTPVSLGDVFFPSFLPVIRELLPNVKFEIDLSNEQRDLTKDGIDFALRAAEIEHPDLIARHLGTIRDVICASPEFLIRAKLEKHPRCLARQPCILHSHETTWNSWTLTSESGDMRVEVTGKYATNQYSAARSMCLSGLGIARIPYYYVTDDLRSGRLVQLFPQYQIATHPLYLVFLRSDYATRKHQITKDTMLKWFQARKEMFA